MGVGDRRVVQGASRGEDAMVGVSGRWRFGLGAGLECRSHRESFYLCVILRISMRQAETKRGATISKFLSSNDSIISICRGERSRAALNFAHTDMIHYHEKSQLVTKIVQDNEAHAHDTSP
jgi:hypothetical protein